MDEFLDEGLREVPNEALTIEMVPVRGASYVEVADFAWTLNGYRFRAQVDRHGTLEDLVASGSLTELRAWLFLWERLKHHMGYYPVEEDEMTLVFNVIDMIREKILARDLS